MTRYFLLSLALGGCAQTPQTMNASSTAKVPAHARALYGHYVKLSDAASNSLMKVLASKQQEITLPPRALHDGVIKIGDEEFVWAGAYLYKSVAGKAIGVADERLLSAVQAATNGGSENSSEQLVKALESTLVH